MWRNSRKIFKTSLKVTKNLGNKKTYLVYQHISSKFTFNLPSKYSSPIFLSQHFPNMLHYDNLSSSNVMFTNLNSFCKFVYVFTSRCHHIIRHMTSKLYQNHFAFFCYMKEIEFERGEIPLGCDISTRNVIICFDVKHWDYFRY
jgi:hypothetical protein